MSLSRRGFLASVLSAIAVGTLHKVIIPEALAADPIAIALEQYRAMLQFRQDRHEDGNDTYRDLSGEDSMQLIGMFDNLLGHCLANFYDGSSTRDDIRRVMLSAWEQSELDEDYLEQLVKDTIPVAFARNCLGAHKMPIRIKYMAHWSPFCKAYSHKIV